VEVEPKLDNGRMAFVPREGSERIYRADLVLLAMGFSGPEKNPLFEGLGISLNRMGNVETDADRRTSNPRVFAAGDMARGQSLIVWAIAEGRHVAHTIDKHLMGESLLPQPLEFGNDQRPFA
jgi:glutamate synthase (NADPH/NADH) small chain